jgi:hypothetical protein
MRPARQKDYSLKKCQLRLQTLNSKAERILDRLVASLEHEERLESMRERLEEACGRCESLSRMQSDSELELNEAVVLADKLTTDLQEMEQVVEDTVILSNHEKYASRLEALKRLFGKLESRLSEIHEASGQGENVVDLLGKFSIFERDAENAEKNMLEFEHSMMLESGKHKSGMKGRIEFAKGHILNVKRRAATVSERHTLERIRHSVEERRSRIFEFMKGEKAGWMSIDRKHVTLQSVTSKRKMAIEFTDATKYALIGMLGNNSISSRIRKLPDNHAILSAYFEPSPKGAMIRIGEKKIGEEAIVYSSVRYEVPFY